MRYIGGKSKLARRLADQIRERSDGCDTYIEPFIGGGAVFAEAAPLFTRAYASDVVPDLVMMWQALFAGWDPPTVVTEEVYGQLKHAEPSALRGFAGFAAAFGGKWFGTYARGKANDGTDRNYAAESARNLTKIREKVMCSRLPQAPEVYHGSYELWTPWMRPGVVVYCDPPYAATTGYDAAGEFDSARFWETMDEWARLGAVVLVSEYSAPGNWYPVWETQHRSTLTSTADRRSVRTERLFGYQWHRTDPAVAGVPTPA